MYYSITVKYTCKYSLVRIMRLLIAFITIIPPTVENSNELYSYFNETSVKVDSILERLFLEKAYRSVGKDSTVRSDVISEFIKYYDVSHCGHDGFKNETNYVKRHILHGLLTDPNVPERHWHEYKSVFNKSYLGTGHEQAAVTVWKQNLQLVAKHNQDYLSGSKTYTLQLNQFADMHVTDYMRKLLKLITGAKVHHRAEDPAHTIHKKAEGAKVPDEFDWRTQGFKPKLEEQWRCGACYAFAITHAMQAQLYKKHRDWRELSPQQIVDCSGDEGNYGCGGGSLSATLRYAANKGLELEVNYPYAGKVGKCQFAPILVAARASKWSILPSGDEQAMQKALATIGPLAIAINAAPKSFQLYRHGVYDDPLCTSAHVNHAMLLVGYTKDYWIILNWWGPRWGENGYMRIKRGLNRCGIANMAAYVEI